MESRGLILQAARSPTRRRYPLARLVQGGLWLFLSCMLLAAGFANDDGGSRDSAVFRPLAAALPAAIAHWRFDGTALDAVGSNHGFRAGDASYVANGTDGGVGSHALSLDGVSGYVNLDSNVSNFPLLDEPRSVTGWFKADAGSQGQSYFAYGPNTLARRFSVAADNTQAVVGLSGHAWGVRGLTLADGWHHIAVTYAGGKSDAISIYIDGALQPAATLAGVPLLLKTATGRGTIGQTVTRTVHYGGLIDDVRLYGEALGAEQVQSIYAQDAPSGSTPPPPPPPPDTTSEDTSDEEPCVSPELRADVEGFADETEKGEEQVARWLRVLAAFGDPNHHTPMTAEEGRYFVDRGWARWPPVVEALECLEARQEDEEDKVTPPPPDVVPEVRVVSAQWLRPGGDPEFEGTPLAFTLHADAAPNQDIDVTVNVSGGDGFVATGETGDRMLVLAAGSRKVDFSVDTDDDATSEDVSSVVTVLLQPRSGYRVAREPLDAASARVYDNDGLPLLWIRDGQATEGEDVLMEVGLSRPVPDKVRVTWETQWGTGVDAHGIVRKPSYGTADASVDFKFSSNSLSFSPGQTSRTIWVPTLEDDDSEGGDSLVEDFTVLLRDAEGAEIFDGDARALIVDDEARGLALFPDRLTVHEGGVGSYMARLTMAPQGGDAWVQVGGLFGTDLEVGTDIGSVGNQSTLLVFTALNWDEAQRVLVSARADEDELDDSVSVMHDLSGGGYGGAQDRQLPVAVRDSGSPPALVGVTGGSAVGEGLKAAFTLTAFPAPKDRLWVGVDVAEQGGFANPGTLGPRMVEIDSAGTATIEIPTVDDALDEPDGSIGVTVLPRPGYVPRRSQRGAVVAVTDNDTGDGKVAGPRPVITISGGPAITEGGDAVFTVSANPAPASDLDVNLVAKDDAVSSFLLLANEGYHLVTVGAGQGSVTFTLGTRDDFMRKADGEVSVSVADGTGYRRGTPGTARVAVRDREIVRALPLVSISDGQASEGDEITMEVTLSEPSDREVEVSLQTVWGIVHGDDGSQKDYGDATSGADFKFSDVTVTFSPGDTRKEIWIQTLEDDGSEGGSSPIEHFTVLITDADGAEIGDGEAMAVIVDDDTNGLALFPENLSVREGGSAGYSVRLTAAPVGGDVSVRVNGAAGTDVLLDAGAGVGNQVNVVFTSSNWDEAQPVTVSAGRDSDGVDDIVTLVHVASGGGYDGLTRGFKVTVEDDDLPILSVDSPVIAEGAPGATPVLRFAVTLNAPGHRDVTVAYAGATGGTATQGGDYQSLPAGTLTLGAGQTRAHIEVTVIGDSIVEGDETVRLEFSSPNNAVFPGGARTLGATGTILDDDDHPPPALSSNNVFISPGGDDATGLGTEASPWATLAHARDAVAAHIASLPDQKMTEDIIVHLRSGTHRLTETLELGAADSGNNGYKVLYRNYPGEEPIVSGGRLLTGWTESATTDRNGGRLFEATVTDSGRFRQLLVGSEAGVQAREPNLGSTLTTLADGWSIDTGPPRKALSMKVPRDADGDNHTDLSFNLLRDMSASEISQVEVWRLTWFNSMLLPIQSFTANVNDGDAYIRGIDAQIDGGRLAANLGWNGGRSSDMPFYWQNALAFIDQPGEWFFDAPGSKVYYKPYSSEVVEPCVSPELRADVEGYADETQNGEEHVARWLRVLSAFGEPNGHTPVTAAEARDFEGRGWDRWTPVAEALDCLEANGPLTATLTPEMTIPVVETLVRLKDARNVWFHGIRFQHSSYTRTSRRGYAQRMGSLPFHHENENLPISTLDPKRQTIRTAQAVRPAPGAIEIEHSANIHFERNAFRHLGANGIVLKEGSKYIGIEGNVFSETFDTHIVPHGGLDPTPTDADHLQGISIANNFMEKPGAGDKHGLHIFAGYPDRLYIDHNHMVDANMGGVNLGWYKWQTGQMPSLRNNSIRNNRLENIIRRVGDWGLVHVKSSTNPGVFHTDVSRNWGHNIRQTTPRPKVVGWYLDDQTWHGRAEYNVTTDVRTRADYDNVFLQGTSLGPARFNAVHSNYHEDTGRSWFAPTSDHTSVRSKPYGADEQPMIDLVKLNAGPRPRFRDITASKHSGSLGGDVHPGGATAGMLSRWTMDFTRDDTMPVRRELSLQGGARFSADAMQGSHALRFDGRADSASVPGEKGVLGSHSRTFAAWVRTSDADARIVSWGRDVHGGKWAIRTRTGAGGRGVLSVAVNGGHVSGSTPVADGEWHHVAVVFEEDSSPDVRDVRLYVDGRPDGFSTALGARVFTARGEDVRFGTNRAFGGVGAEMSEGLIDDARLYDRALLASEVAHLAEKRVAANWQFENDTADLSGNGHALTLHGGAAYSSDGVIGGASLSLDGVDDYAVATGYAGVTGTRPRTVSAWIRTTDTSGTIVAWGVNQSGEAFNLHISPQSAAGVLRFDGGGTQITGTTNLADGAWHHVAVVWASDGTPQGAEVAHLFVDGYPETISSSSERAMDTSGSGTVHVGGAPWNLGNAQDQFAGEVDSLRIFDEALSPFEVHGSVWSRPVPRVGIAVAGSGRIITEGQDIVFTVTAEPPPTSDLEVQLHILNDRGGRNSLVAPADLGDKTIIIKANESSASHTVPTVGDGARESNITVSAQLVGSANYVLGGRRLVQVAVYDDYRGHPWVTVSGGRDIVEGDKAVFTVHLDAVQTRDMNVRLVIDDADGADFVEDSEQGVKSVTIPSGKRSATYGVPTLDDDVLEVSGSISATLTIERHYPVVPSYTIGVPSGAKVKVADDDLLAVTIAGGDAIVEGGEAVFTVSATPAPRTDLDITLRIADADTGGFLPPGEAGQKNVRIPAGASSVTYRVPTVDDQVVEGAGEVSGTLVAGAGYVLASPGAATVVVADDETPAPTLGIAGGAAITEGGVAEVTVLTSSAVGVPLVVKLEIEDDIASDFLAPGSEGVRTVTIPANDHSVVFRMRTVDDQLQEAGGSVSATLVPGLGYEIGSPVTGKVAVSDNDSAFTVEFAEASSSRDEDDCCPWLRIKFSEPAPATVINYAVVGGTAEQGVDYRGARTGHLPGSLTVPKGATGVGLNVSTITDEVYEADETVVLMLTAGAGYTPGSVNTHTLTIRNDDPALFYLAPGGSDAGGTGSQANPWGTLAKARDEIANIIAGFPNRRLSEDIVVRLRAGTYLLSETLVLDADDSGSNGYKVLYRNHPGEEPVISGGRPVLNWRLSGGGSRRYEAAVPDGSSFRSLYVSNEARPRAREPDTSHRLSAAGNLDADATRLRSILVREDSDSNGATDPEFTALLAMTADEISQVEYWQLVNFRAMQLPIASFARHGTRTGHGVAAIRGDDAQKDARLGSGAACIGCPYYWENALAFLDTPGEWFLDQANNKVYYHRRFGEGSGSRLTRPVRVPVLETLVRLENARNIWFHGIRFEHTDHAAPSSRGHVQPVPGLMIRHEDAAAPVSTGVPGADRVAGAGAWAASPGAIEIVGSENIHFERNAFRHLGANGIVLGEGARHIGIEGNVFLETADTHIVIHGGMDPSPSEAAAVRGISISNNVMERAGSGDKIGLGVFAGYPRRAYLEHNQVGDSNSGGFSVGWGSWAQGRMPGLGRNRVRHNRFEDVLGLVNNWGVVHLRSATDAGVPHTDLTRNWASDITDDHPGNRIAGWQLGERASQAGVVENVTSDVTSGGFDPVHVHSTAGNNTVERNFDEGSTTKWSHPGGAVAYGAADHPVIDMVKQNAGLRPAYKDLVHVKDSGALGGEDAPGGAAAGLLSMWPMERSLEDAMPAGHDLAFAGAAGYSPDAMRGASSLSITGSDDHATATGYKGVLGTGSRTFAAWIKTLDTDAVIASWGDDISGGKWVVRTRTDVNVAGVLALEVNGGHAAGSTMIADGEWHHVAVVFDGDVSPDVADVRLYVDGRIENFSGVAPVTVSTVSGQDVRFGSTNTLASGAEMSEGLIDDPRIYDRALLASEVAHLALKRLEANWSFDNVLADLSGNGRTLTLGNGAMFEPNGALGGASLRFDGVNDYAVAKGYTGIIGTNPRTVTAWIKTTDTRGTMVSWGHTGRGRLMRIMVFPRSGTGILMFAGNNTVIRGTTDIADGAWHHIAVVWAADGRPRGASFGQLYVDGYPDAPSLSFSANPLNTTDGADVHIGGSFWRLSDSAHAFGGEISHLRIFNEALTPVEINEMARR